MSTLSNKQPSASLRLKHVVLAGLLLIGVPAFVLAQERPAAAVAGRSALTGPARALLAEPAPAPRLDARPGGLFDQEAGVYRALRLSGAPASPQAPSLFAAGPAAAALAGLDERIGWGGDADRFELVRVQESPAGSHVTFQQTFDGVPVRDALVRVAVGQDGRAAFVSSRYAPQLDEPDRFPSFSRTPLIPLEEAERLATESFIGGARLLPGELQVLPEAAGPRLAWRLIAHPYEARGEFELLVDARTGEIVSVLQQAMHRFAHVEEWMGGHVEGKKGGERKQNAGHASMRSHVHASAHPHSTDGAGLVFEPDPLTSSGQPYGGVYSDMDDQNAEALNRERKLVTLPELTVGSDGLTRLQGPFARIVRTTPNGTVNYDPPAEADPQAFQYTRADDRFEAVNAYYHVDKSQRYVQSLGFTGRQDVSIAINPYGEGSADNSAYYPGLNMLSFGAGGIDDAEDAFVIWHEYGHALIESAVPALYRTAEGQAYHEGWADYWGASHTRRLMDSGEVPEGDWRRLFMWDGNARTFQGRRMDSNGVYPKDVVPGNPYATGLLWATTLMEVYDAVGGEVTDRLTLQSHYYLTGGLTLAEAAVAVVEADFALYDGAHSVPLIEIFSQRGFVEPSQFGPQVAHIPLGDTEQIGGDVSIEVRAQGPLYSIQEVSAVVQIGAQPEATLTLLGTEDGGYSTDLALPDTPAFVRYAILVRDANGVAVRLPERDWYSFQAGPDAKAPVIVHSPVTRLALAAWPAEIAAQVSDNLGVDSVRVSYTLRSSTGAERVSGTFGLAALSGGTYRGAFPIGVAQIEEGDRLQYRIEAEDVAATPNTAVLPETGEPAFEIELTERGVLAVYDFESGASGVVASEGWALGAPAFGVRVARSGQRVWGTNLDRPYPAQNSLATLELPPVDLAGTSRPLLLFWHWHDFEHDGQAGRSNATLWDGGIVQVSTDGGQTWTSAEPRGGYDGTIPYGYGNPLSDQPAFGGYSYGWIREQVQLPVASDVRVRFVFGTDSGNTETARSYAGWYIDDVQIALEPPVDEDAPEILATPPLDLVHAFDAGPVPELRVEVRDDVGVQRVQALYAIEQRTRRFEGVLRLEMDPDSLNIYRGRLPFLPDTLAPGDVAFYTISVFDPSSLGASWPVGASARVQVRLIDDQDLLAEARPSGIWEATGSSWTAVLNSGAPQKSSLVLPPSPLPANAARLLLTMEHAYDLPAGATGRVMASTDAGATWAPLSTTDDIARFTGSAERAAAVFDITGRAGETLWMRLDLDVPNPGAGVWRVDGVALRQTADVDAFDTDIPFALYPAYPNPFVDSATLTYSLAEPGEVELALYDPLGRRVRMLAEGVKEAGSHVVALQAGALASGVYLARLTSGGSEAVRQVVLLK